MNTSYQDPDQWALFREVVFRRSALNISKQNIADIGPCLVNTSYQDHI